MLTFIVCPPDRPQVFTAPAVAPPPAPPKLDWLEQRILNLVGECEPAKLWSILNLVGDGLSPNGRAEARELRLRLLRRVERLIQLGLLFRGRRNQIATYKFMPKPVIRRARRLKPSVAKATSTKSVSELTLPSPPKQVCRPIPVCAQVVAASQVGQRSPSTEAKTESVAQHAQIIQAAKTLARLPRRQKRKLTGWLHGQRCWRGRLLLLPDGEVAPLLWCNRGRVLLRNYREMEVLDFLCWAGRRERDVRLYKNPEAVLLGAMKRGVRERRSDLKAASARRNGHLPPREGSRPRGRPRCPMPYVCLVP